MFVVAYIALAWLSSLPRLPHKHYTWVDFLPLPCALQPRPPHVSSPHGGPLTGTGT